MDSNRNHQLNIGIVGAGGFASFASHAFLKVEGIKIKGVYDIDMGSARKLAGELNATAYTQYQELLDDADIDLIYIGTPPYLHYEQTLQALQAGKHVICEKPAALHTGEAEEIASLAHSSDLLYTVNLMQRYNPLYTIVQKIIDEKWMGEFVHGFFENYASDEKLTEGHWFWNREQSGGIFIEHGVHFFDMFHGWFGAGKLAHAMEIKRAGTENVFDRVQAVVLYNNAPVNFYHGFNQPKVLDRQELRLQFESGDITLYEWIPVKIRMHGLFTLEQMDIITNHFPGTHIVEHKVEPAFKKSARGNFKEIRFDKLLTITSGSIADKMQRYEELVIAMITDQWSWIRNRSHPRRIDSTNAVESLRIAEAATNMSVKYNNDQD